MSFVDAFRAIGRRLDAAPTVAPSKRSDPYEVWAAHWGQVGNPGTYERPLPFEEACEALPEFFIKDGVPAPKGRVNLMSGTIEMQRPFVTQAGGISIVGQGTKFRGASTLVWNGSGPAFTVDPIGSGSAHGVLFSSFALALPRHGPGKTVLSYGFHLNGGMNLDLERLNITGGLCGVRLAGASTNLGITNCAGGLISSIQDDDSSEWEQREKRGAFLVVDSGSSAIFAKIIGGSSQFDSVDCVAWIEPNASANIEVTGKLENNPTPAGNPGAKPWHMRSIVTVDARKSDLNADHIGIHINGAHLNVTPSITSLVRQIGGRTNAKVSIDCVTGRAENWFEWNGITAKYDRKRARWSTDELV